MPDVVIENPVINSPFDEPRRHFYFSDDGITDKIVESRRLSSYFVPIPPSRKRSGKEQLVLETVWTRDRQQENKFINDIRNAVAKWRFVGYDGITNTKRTLLEYWKRPDRERRLFFCQIEALETAIYFAELSDRRDAWIREDLRTANAVANPLLNRAAFKMATGSGKTVVMAMIIAWHTLNKLADPKIDPLCRLLPDRHPRHHHSRPSPRSLLNAARTGALRESPDEMVRRVCRGFGKRKGGLLVINDEAHHCYRPRERDSSVRETSQSSSRRR